MRSPRLDDGYWMTPDLLGGDITNPQSLNRYAYALNNPATFTDPLGLDSCSSTNNPDGSVTTNCTVTGSSPTDFQILPCSYEAIAEAACYGGWSPAPPGWYEGSTSGGTSTPPPAPGPKPAPSMPGIGQRLACAANFGDAHSLASLFGIQNSVAGEIAFGNTASALVNLGISVFGSNSSITGGQIGNIVLTGARQGIPGGGPGGKGVLGQAQDAAIGATVSAGYNAVAGVGAEPLELGITASGKVASVAVPLSEATVSGIVSDVTIAKFVYDAGTFLYGLGRGCSQ